MDNFRVAIAHGFHKSNGSPYYPGLSFSPFDDDPHVDYRFLPEGGVIEANDIAGCRALMLNWGEVRGATLAGDPQLAIVTCFGVGYDSVDMPALTERGIALVNAPDGVRRPVAVGVMTLMLALANHLFVKDRLARQGPEGWAHSGDYVGMGLIGCTLGLLGLGNIGAEVVRLAKPLDMTFIAHDPYADCDLAAQLDVELVDLQTLFKRADVLTLHCPLTESTRHLVGENLLRRMKPTALLINTARGAVVDHDALIAALSERWIAGAAIDVFEQEPNAADDPLTRMDNVILTPHAICQTDQFAQTILDLNMCAILAVKAGLEPDNIVNGEVRANPLWREHLAALADQFGKA